MNQQVVHQRHAAAGVAAAPALPFPPPPSDGSKKTTRRNPRVKAKMMNGRLKMAVMGIGAVIAIIGVFGLLYKMIFYSHAVDRIFHHSTKLAFPKSDSSMMDHKHEMPLNAIYSSPDSMSIVGDRSDRYAKLRMQVDPLLPVDEQRSLQRVQELTSHVFTPMTMVASDLIHNSDQVQDEQVAAASNSMPYDIYNCPDVPPTNYPFEWNMLDILKAWPPDDVSPRAQIHQGLCVFDYTKDYDKAMVYRAAELPYVVINDPSVQRTVERWNEPGYMQALMGNELHRCEYSENNHFMYYVPVSKVRRKNKQIPENWKEPTKLLRMTYQDWLTHANVTDDLLGPDHPHWYFRLIGCGLMGNDGSCDRGSSEYLYDELPFFQPKPSLYIVDPHEQKGIHCRFGMKGVIAENHFDGSRNSIVVLGGSRRYILSHPNQCENLHLYKKGHPSARHSAVDWNNPDLEAFPLFKQARSNEVVLQPGQVLYLPTNWFHFIVSLELNFQCNTRSGISQDYMPPIHKCGF